MTTATATMQLAKAIDKLARSIRYLGRQQEEIPGHIDDAIFVLTIKRGELAFVYLHILTLEKIVEEGGSL